MKANKILAIVLIAVLSLGCGFAGGVLSQKYMQTQLSPAENLNSETDMTDIRNASKDKDKDDSNTEIEPDTKNNPSTEYDEVAVGIAEKVMSSVVSVTTNFNSSYSSDFGDIYDWFFGGGGGRSYEANSVGTGFIVDSNGYIVTNSHVVNDGDYNKIMISLYDGTQYEGEVKFSDNILDLAIVKIDATGLKPASLGDSSKLKIGSYAAAIGNPLGLTFERSMSQGIISGLNRTITVGSSSTNATTMEGLIQTDAAINSGNSGGPLLDKSGKVIGIASAKASDGESMGFAIPINTAKPIIEQIIKTGSFERVYLGITAIGIEEQSNYSNMNKDALMERFGATSGVYIASVNKNGGADKAGLKAGDVILTVNDTKVGTMNKIYSVLIAYKKGDVVDITYLRDGTENTTRVVLMTSDELSRLDIIS